MQRIIKMQLPGLRKNFSELSLTGKIIYVGSVISAVIGGVLALWQTVVYAGERFDNRVLYLINDNAYTAVVEQVENKLDNIEKQNRNFYIMNQISIKQIELRTIENEIRNITRNSTSLTSLEQTEIQQLRDDRNRIQSEIRSLKNSLSDIDSI